MIKSLLLHMLGALVFGAIAGIAMVGILAFVADFFVNMMGIP